MSTDDDDHPPEHLPSGPGDWNMAVDEFQAKLDRLEQDRHRRQLLASDRCPQPYDRSAESIQDWERDLMINGGITVKGQDGWEIRKEGTDSDDRRYIRSTLRYPSLEDVR